METELTPEQLYETYKANGGTVSYAQWKMDVYDKQFGKNRTATTTEPKLTTEELDEERKTEYAAYLAGGGALSFEQWLNGTEEPQTDGKADEATETPEDTNTEETPEEIEKRNNDIFEKVKGALEKGLEGVKTLKEKEAALMALFEQQKITSVAEHRYYTLQCALLEAELTKRNIPIPQK